MKNTGLGPIQGGSTAVVIGGGPGGVASAVALKQGARASGRDIRVILLEGKQFAGEKDHNQCAGVLSPPIASLLTDDLCIPFPDHLCRNQISGYVLHTERQSIVLDGESDYSYALRRVQFDDYMLNAARSLGIDVRQIRVSGIEIHDNYIQVYTDNDSFQADVVIGAFGLDETAAAAFSRTVSYRPPSSQISIITKFHAGRDAIRKFDSRIHAFLPVDPSIEFGAVTPKDEYITINIAGTKITQHHLEKFLRLPEVARVVNGRLDNIDLHDQPHPVYFGRFPSGLARGYFGDRFVMVGDAAGLVRAFKGKGITSAVQTGIRAAGVILNHGISRSAFKIYVDENRDIIRDLPYGKAMRMITGLGARTHLLDAVISAAHDDANLRQALFDAVSAHRPYRGVVKRTFNIPSMLKITGELINPSPTKHTGTV